MGIQFGKAGLNVADRIDFFKNLSGWLNAGAGRASVAEAVANTADAFSHDEYSTLKPQMDNIKREVQSGQITLYEALRASGLGFTAQEIAIIEAAEKTNQLRQAVPALVAAMDMQQKGRKQLSGSLLGPLMIGVMLIAMSLGVLIFMLPLVIEPVISRNEKAFGKFPLILQYYWHASVWLRANPFVIPGVITALVALFLARNTVFLRPYYQKFLLGWSVSRKLILGFNAVLVVYFMPALLRSGLPAYRVCSNLADCVGNATLAQLFRTAAQDHENGMRLSKALEIIPFRASFANAIAAGEASGAIADRVQDLQEPYSLEMQRQVAVVVGTLKFIVMAVLLPFFIVSTYTALVGPIFALMEY
jgi:type II secretory pathway component PulF